MQLTIDNNGRRKCKATKTEQAKLVAACGVLSAYAHCTDSLAALDARANIEQVLLEMDGKTDTPQGDESHDGSTQQQSEKSAESIDDGGYRDPNAAADNQPASPGRRSSK